MAEGKSEPAAELEASTTPPAAEEHGHGHGHGHEAGGELGHHHEGDGHDCKDCGHAHGKDHGHGAQNQGHGAQNQGHGHSTGQEVDQLKELQAKTGSALPTRTQLVAFLKRGIKVMSSDTTRDMLKDHAIEHTGKKLVEIQREGWTPHGIDHDVGCAYLNQIDSAFPGDNEMITLRNQFIHTAMRTYLRSLEDRAPKVLERKAKLPRATILDFFDACNTKMDLPETQQVLLDHMQKHGSMPNQIIINMQRDLLEVIGWERDHGCAMLSRVGQDYPNDKELVQRFQAWQMKAKQTMMTVVKQHQDKGGDLPMPPHADNPEMSELQEKAKEEITKMTPMERGELIQKMQKKVEVFANLPHEARVSHMKKMRDDDKLEFVKTQLLLVSMMKEQWAQQQQASGGMMQSAMPPNAPACPVSAPSQQTM